MRKWMFGAVVVLAACGGPAPSDGGARSSEETDQPPTSAGDESTTSPEAVAEPSTPNEQAAPVVGTPDWWRSGTCRPQPGHTVPLADRASEDVAVAFAEGGVAAGGVVAWASGRNDVSVAAFDETGALRAGPHALRVTGAWRGTHLVANAVEGGFVVVSHGRCGAHRCLYGFAFDAAGSPLGEPVTERLRNSIETEAVEVPASQRTAGQLWLRRYFGSGSRDGSIELFRVSIQDDTVRFERSLRGTRTQRRVGSEYAQTSAALVYGSQSADALTGWEADDASGDPIRGRSLYIGEAGGEIRGLGLRVHDFVVEGGRAHLLVERERGSFRHVVATVSGSDDATISSQTDVDADALPPPFAGRGRLALADGELRYLDALGRPVGESVAISEGAVRLTAEGVMHTRVTDAGLVITPVVCAP